MTCCRVSRVWWIRVNKLIAQFNIYFIYVHTVGVVILPSLPLLLQSIIIIDHLSYSLLNLRDQNYDEAMKGVYIKLFWDLNTV